MLKPCQFTRYFPWSKSNGDRRGRASIFTRYSLVSLERKELVKSRHGHAPCCQLKTESPDKSCFQSSFAPRRIPFKKGDEREDSCPPPLLSRAVSFSGAIAKNKSDRLSDKILSDHLKTNIYADSNLLTQKSQLPTPKSPKLTSVMADITIDYFGIYVLSSGI